jgi:hypothetical protein
VVAAGRTPVGSPLESPLYESHPCCGEPIAYVIMLAFSFNIKLIAVVDKIGFRVTSLPCCQASGIWIRFNSFLHFYCFLYFSLRDVKAILKRMNG